MDTRCSSRISALAAKSAGFFSRIFVRAGELLDGSRHSSRVTPVLDVTVQTQILNRYGFHARPSTQFVQLAKSFVCQVFVTRTDEKITADGKSVMELLTLGALAGTPISIRCVGPDAADAAAMLKQMVDDRFGGIE